MDSNQLKNYIVSRLGNSANRNDLILEICDKYNLSWPETEKLVQEVESSQEHRIVGRRFPLLFIIALFFFAGGSALIIYNVYIIAIILLPEIQSILLNQEIISILPIFFFMSVSPISEILIGAAMIIGSLVGMRRAWSPVIDHLLERNKINN